MSWFRDIVHMMTSEYLFDRVEFYNYKYQYNHDDGHGWPKNLSTEPQETIRFKTVVVYPFQRF